MKLTQLIKESKLISEHSFDDNSEYGRFATVVIPITGKGGKADITFDVETGPKTGWTGIILDFVPKGKKMAELATEIAGYNQSLEEQKAIGEQIAKWVSKKIKPFPAYEYYSPKNRCRVGIALSKLVKKIK